MKTITLSQIQNEAKMLQDTQNITYNQSLQIIAQKNGFKSYQAILNQIKNDYIYDENEQIKEFKSNVFENRKHIKSNFIKISKLSKKFNEIELDDKYNDDEEKREEAGLSSEIMGQGYKTHQTRVLAEAIKTHLKLDEALPVLSEKIATQISNIF